MSARTAAGELSLRQSVIKQQCLTLRLPTLASQCGPLAELLRHSARLMSTLSPLDSATTSIYSSLTRVARNATDSSGGKALARR